MEFINGESRRQIILMPDCIDDYIQDSNSARVIEAYINSLDLVELGCTRQQPNATGRPMYDPKDLLKLYLYGYMNKIRSSRRLETESGRNLELIWLLRTLCPDHKTIAEFRRQNGEALKNLFKGFVKVCVKLGLYGKELLAIDGSKFKAGNSKERNYTEGKLNDRIEHLENKI
jgi:transposase